MRRRWRCCGSSLGADITPCIGTTTSPPWRRPKGEDMQLSKAQLMCSFRRRLRLAREAAAAEEAAKNNPLLNDPWCAPTSRLHGRLDWDGREYITAQQILD